MRLWVSATSPSPRGRMRSWVLTTIPSPRGRMRLRVLTTIGRCPSPRGRMRLWVSAASPSPRGRMRPWVLTTISSPRGRMRLRVLTTSFCAWARLWAFSLCSDGWLMSSPPAIVAFEGGRLVSLSGPRAAVGVRPLRRGVGPLLHLLCLRLRHLLCLFFARPSRRPRWAARGCARPQCRRRRRRRSRRR